ncbi:MAG: glutamyl-tRNA reductase [Firmicutes bacterium]|nr:glutamyl-tRNA reductase [Bacillota bacterium]
MQLLLVGTNHEIAPVSIRERLSFSKSESKRALAALIATSGISEALVLSTCNRVEVLAVSNDNDIDSAAVKLCGFLARHGGFEDSELDGYLYTYLGLKAVEHVFLVAAGLDSMILGEDQILGQVRSAYVNALEEKAVGPVLDHILRKAIQVGKRVRNETEIGRDGISVGRAAVELGRRIFGSLAGRVVLAIGAGEISELVVRDLARQGATSVVVANRTYEKACELAKAFGGIAIRFDGIRDWLERVDIVISSTGAPHIVIKKSQVEGAIRHRNERALFFIDLAVPRDVDPDVGKLPNVFLYNIDDLKTVMQRSDGNGGQPFLQARAIVAEKTEEVEMWFRERAIIPVISALRGRFEEIRREAVEEAWRKLPHLGIKEKEIINAVTISMINKLLHGPIMGLKNIWNAKSPGKEDEGALLHLVARLLGLNHIHLDGPQVKKLETGVETMEEAKEKEGGSHWISATSL